MLNAFQVADAILTQSDPSVGDLISNLKLQKLLYYAQGFHLAIYGTRFFEEDVYAWQYGPVVPTVYHKFKDNGSEVIPMPVDFDDSIFNQNQKDLIKEVYSVYGQFSALKLMDMTHSEPPYMTTEIGQIINDGKLIDYFQTRLV